MIHPAKGVTTYEEGFVMQAVLALVGIIMIANLICMVIIGGWTTFVSRLELDDNPDKPRWLGHIDPGTLKTKLAGALVSISGIHPLKTFIQIGAENSRLSREHIILQIVIHIVFVVSTLILAISDLYVRKKIRLDRHEEN